MPFTYKLPGTQTELTPVLQTGSTGLPAYFIGKGSHPYIDNGNQQRSQNKKYQDQLTPKQLDIQKQNRDNTLIKQFIDTDIDTKLGSATGAYIPEQNTIKFGQSAGNNPSIIIHEYSHASKAIPQESKIQSIISNTKYNDSYYDSPTEIYSRLMEARQAQNLDPNKQYNTKQIEKLKEQAASKNQSNNFGDRYDTPILKQFINDVASNQPKIQTNHLLSKFGSKLPILNHEG